MKGKRKRARIDDPKTWGSYEEWKVTLEGLHDLNTWPAWVVGAGARRLPDETASGYRGLAVAFSPTNRLWTHALVGVWLVYDSSTGRISQYTDRQFRKTFKALEGEGQWITNGVTTGL